MRQIGFVLWVFATFASIPAYAQSEQRPAEFPITPKQVVELEEWLPKAIDWIDWERQNRNKIERDWFDRVKDRKPKPPHPAWLDEQCQIMKENGVTGDDILIQSCKVLTEMYLDMVTLLNGAQTINIQRKRWQIEVPDFTSFWSYVHIDMPNAVTQTGSDTYSWAGMHMTILKLGRVNIISPGALLVADLPSMYGRRRTVAVGLFGFGYRLMDFRWFGSNQVSSLYINIAKFRVPGEMPGTSSQLDFGGFSVTMPEKKPRPPKIVGN